LDFFFIFNQYNKQSTDTGDYFPEGYNAEEEIAFSSGMMGSQAGQGGNREGPQLPGKFHPLFFGTPITRIPFPSHLIFLFFYP
jgi:hypothetical protein